MRLSWVVLMSLVIVLAGSLTAEARGGGHGGSHSVSGHFPSKGTCVVPHHATNPNKTRLDNWSTKGNVNPYTGKVGTKPLDLSPPKH
jgi:hypothetical protein